MSPQGAAEPRISPGRHGGAAVVEVHAHPALPREVPMAGHHGPSSAPNRTGSPRYFFCAAAGAAVLIDRKCANRRHAPAFEEQAMPITLNRSRPLISSAALALLVGGAGCGAAPELDDT